MPVLNHFFISYSRESSEDFQFALRLARDLRAASVSVWLDQLDYQPGQEIEKILADSAGFILVLSPEALRSAQVESELSEAKERGKWIEAILFRDCAFETLLPVHRLTRVQDRLIDFRIDYESGIHKLIGGRGLGEGGMMEDDWGSVIASRETKQRQQQQQFGGNQGFSKQGAGKPTKKNGTQKLQRMKPPHAYLDYEPTGAAPEAASRPAWFARDNVQFTLTGPPALAPGEPHALLFWVHLEEQRATVLLRAASELGLSSSELSVNSEGPYPLERGSRLSVRMTIAGLNCADDHKWITWTGEIGKTTFIVDVPAGTAEGMHIGSVSIRFNDCEIARMSFLVRVGAAAAGVQQIPSTTTAHRKAFASYASQDRVEVLGRVQGMEAAWKGLDVFVDVMSLRSGQSWELELVKHISEADVFYLFWCHHARASEWVTKEWRLALQAKGLDFIDPVPLESPTDAPPPPELAAKHFNDPVLAFIKVAGEHT